MLRTPRRAVLGTLALVLLVACGRSPDEETATTTTTAASAPAPSTTPATSTDASASAEPTTTLEKPEIELPDEIPTELVVSDLEEGTGTPAASGDTVVVRYVGVRSEDGTEFDNNFDGDDPFPVTLGAGGVIEGWDQGLVGIKQGGRRQLDIPADLAYGDQPRGDVIQAGDALTFVVDALVVIPATDPEDAPTVPIAGAANVEELTIEDQVVGEGETLEVGKTAVLHAVFLRADTGEVLLSTWEGGQPESVRYVRDEMVQGLYEGLTGMKVGGRRMVSIPFAGIDSQTSEPFGLPAEVDLVAILDLLAVY